MITNALEITGLTKEYGKFRLDVPELTLPGAVFSDLSAKTARANPPR